MTSAIEITPMVADGIPVITSYGGGGFRIEQQLFTGSIIILPGLVQQSQLAFDEGFQAEMLRPVYDAADQIDMLIVGCGETFYGPPEGLQAGLKKHGIVLEWMDTGAACRTFNVLLSEHRRVAAALIVTQ